MKQVRPTLWDAAGEARARRAGLKSLRSGLLGDSLTASGVNQLGRALRELRVSSEAWRSLDQQWLESTLNPLSTGGKSLEPALRKPDVQRGQS